MEAIRAMTCLVMAIFLSLVNVAEADQLQFRIQVNGGATDASFANVRLLNAQNVEQFKGDADRYGRIEARIAPGNYRAVVSVRGQTKTGTVNLTGGGNLQIVTLH